MIFKTKGWSVLVALLLLISTPLTAFAEPSAYISGTKINGLSTNYMVVDMNNQQVQPLIMTAGNNLCSADSVANMARNNNCFAAINGTYFSAYDGIPVPWGTIIRNGKVLHVSNGGAVAGFTSQGRLVVDRLSFHFKGYINGEYRAIPWRINHPSDEAEAITIFTPEYGAVVKMAGGAKAPVVENGTVTYIATTDFYVPAGGFAIVYNPQVADLVDERFQVGDQVRYEVEITPTFTKAETWDSVIQAVGAGPSLIINGQVTADGEAEQFFEGKILTGKAARTFIGAGADGKVRMGTIQAATIKEAAAVCQGLGLINAMCLDGGGSIALYHQGKSLTAGRKVNNALGFTYSNNAPLTKASHIQVQVDGVMVDFEGYNIDGSNYLKLRDLAMAVNHTEKNFQVAWDQEKKAVQLLSETAYTPVGGELAWGDGSAKTIAATSSPIYVDGQSQALMAYSIGGNNYFKLRDVAQLFDIAVDYDYSAKTITIQTK
ncbi:phosphodiester glycosidase family protein [Aminipila butyrica]|uniref:Phosphodiester glycosidase family protein n=1 Tax=Aminipila butyrica TaxID=433296 RepID=A0A858C0X7_9FIRM|nr:phosphodiester glycosidase family protein [Aminipila butyrica]QIB70056.1 phosphodiester glycosidase family protein [Aminipila butyrica]